MSRATGERLGLPELVGYDTTLASAYRNLEGRTYCAAILLGKDALRPKTLSLKTGIQLSLKIMGGKIAPRLRLTLWSPAANRKNTYQSCLEFYPGLDGQVTGFTYDVANDSEIRIPTGAVSEEAQHYCIAQWHTIGGVGTGLEGTTSDADTNEVLRVMKELLWTSNTQQRKVRLLLFTGTWTDFSLYHLLQHEAPKAPWHAYLDRHNQVQCLPFNGRRHVLVESGGLIRYPERNFFSTPNEALLILAYGMAIEYQCDPKLGLRSTWPNCSWKEYRDIQVRALRKLFMDDSELHVRWSDAILNQSPAGLEQTTIISSSSDPHDFARSQLDTLLRAWNWADQPKKVLEAAMVMTGYMNIIQGPPGSGKSRTLAGIATLYLSCDFSVILCAQTAAGAQVLFEYLTDLLHRFNMSTPMSRIIVKPLALYRGSSAYFGVTQRNPRWYREQRAIVTTANFACCKGLREHFGESTRGILVIHDDSHLALESEILSSVFSLRHSSRVLGLVMAADVLEWPLEVATQIDPHRPMPTRAAVEKSRSSRSKKNFDYLHSQFYGLNEFADQTGLPLVTRLVRQGFPCNQLRKQYRMKEILMAFPKGRIYRALLESLCDISTNGVEECFFEVVRNWLKVRFGDAGAQEEGPRESGTAEEATDRYGSNVDGTDLDLIFANVTDGYLEKVPDEKASKWNAENVDVVVDLLLRNREANAVRPDDVVVLTPYRAQVELYEDVIRERTKDRAIERDSLPCIVTFDSFRGREANIIILDLVVTTERGSHQFGIVGHEYRALLATTRAKKMLIIVGSMGMLEGSFVRSWAERMTELSRDKKGNSHFIFDKAEVPYVVAYAEYLLQQKLVFPIVSRCGSKIEHKNANVKVKIDPEAEKFKTQNWIRPRQQRVYDYSAIDSESKNKPLPYKNDEEVNNAMKQVQQVDDGTNPFRHNLASAGQQFDDTAVAWDDKTKEDNW